jgi:ABC-2 type transport system ATP-binding protein
MINSVLSTKKLSKSFGDVAAVSEVDLQVNEGLVFGFLGPNGAGKTTTIGMMLGLIHSTSGEVEIFGGKVSPKYPEPLRQVGSLVGRPALLPYLSGRENLQLLAMLYKDVGAARIDIVLEQVGMTFASERKVKTYSTGMKQRMGLAAAILHRPSLVILDEPTNGLDPAGMREVRELIASLKQEGTTIFLSSHLLHEVEQVCDQIAVINQGYIVAQGSVNEMLRDQEPAIRVRVSSTERATQVLQSLPGITQLTSNGAYVEIKGVSSTRIVAHLARHDLPPSEVVEKKSDLESLFLGVTQGKDADSESI